VDLLHRVAEAERVKQAAEAIKERVRESRVVHGDETGWRESGQNGYIWLFCTPDGERYYEYDRSRAGAVAKRILGAQFKGTLCTDFYAAYNDFPGEHQRCWAHLLRDLHALKEEHKGNEGVMEWAGEWAGELHKLYDTAQDALRGPAPPADDQRQLLDVRLVEATQELAARYANANNAKEHRAHPCHTLSKRLLLHLEGLFQFVRQSGLAPDNNLAERSVRPVVVMRCVRCRVAPNLRGAAALA